MYLTKKIRLLPTKEQEILFWKSVGVARWSYNYFLSESYRVYQEWLNDNSKPKHISEQEVRKYINNVLKKTTHTWLKDVGSNVMKQGVKDANIALQNFFKHNKGYPKFKSKKKSKPSFDGRFWYLSVGYRAEAKQVKLIDKKVGIDIGLKDLAIVSNSNNSYTKKYRNINKGYRVRLLEK